MTEILDKEIKVTEFVKNVEVETSHYISKQEYLTLKAEWSKALREGYQPESWEFLTYNILRDKPADRGFKEKTKNIQGNSPWYAVLKAVSDALHKVNPLRQKPLIEFHGCPIPKGFRDKLLAAKDSKRG